MMGGVMANIHGQALTRGEDGEDKIVEGLVAVGEIACVSVHGANRLGGNSLLDLVVFGRSAGKFLGEYLTSDLQHKDASSEQIDAALARLNRWENNKDGEDPAQIKKDMQLCMQLNFSVFREGKAMAEGLAELKKIRERLQNAKLSDNSAEFNTQRIECLELDNLMETAFATAMAANFREESRGAHSREDFPERDDENWLCHSVYHPQSETMTKREVNFSPKTREAFPPKARTY
jgi:succinate dehydrogenase / fumarate reductase flavoprotein subunit